MPNPFNAWLVALPLLAVAWTAAAQGGATHGAQAFRQCLACHSLEPGRHLTGPSLAGVVGRRAGEAAGFSRYSPALAASALTWDRDTLDRWLADPAALVPDTSMRIRPVADPDMRRDLIAFLETVTQDPAAATAGHGMQMGGMAPGQMPDLAAAEPRQQVSAIRHCGDAYRVTLGTGKTYTFWEFNLRFKSDSSAQGPRPGKPAIVGQGMQGDRAQVVFADPAEISAFIRKECPQ